MEKYDIDDLYAVTIAPIKYYKAFNKETICTMLKFGYDTVARKDGNGYYDIVTKKYFGVFEDSDFEYLRKNLKKWYVFGNIIPLRIYLKEAKETLSIEDIRNIYYKMNDKKTNYDFDDKFMSTIIQTKKYIETNLDGDLQNIYLDKLFDLTDFYIRKLIYSDEDNDKIISACSLELLNLVKDLGGSSELTSVQKTKEKCKKKVLNNK